MPKSLSSLTPEDFEPRGGETFTLAAYGTEVAFKLVAVERLGAAVRGGGAFSLQFTAPPGPLLPQAIYPLAHPALGTLELFVVPLGPKDGGNRYEIVFA